MNQEHPDDEILAGIGRRLAGVDNLVPQAPKLDFALAGSAPVQTRVVVQSRVGFAGFAPLVLVAAVVAVAVGLGLGSRTWGGNGSPDRGPSTTILWKLVAPPGIQLTDADLEATVAVVRSRLSSTGIVDPVVQKIPPDEFSVTLYGAADATAIQSLVGSTGQLSFVLLPPATYGTGTAPGIKPIPNVGEAIDPSLPVQFTGAELDSTSVSAAALPMGSGTWVVNFSFKASAAPRFETWTAQHIDDYFAIVLDRKVVSVPYLESTITGGQGQIGGHFTAESAKQLATILQYGALPYPLEQISVTTNPGPVAIGAPTVVVPANFLPSGVTTSGRTIGDPNAPVTVDVWLDYQCPACSILDQDIVPRVIDAYVKPGKARLAFHDFIVIDQNVGGTESLDAANAARCAADQGKFATYLTWLFANQSTEGSGGFTKARLVEIARTAGLDAATFKTCVENGTHVADVQAESASSQTLSLVGTPSVIVNGKLVPSNSYDDIKTAIDAALAKASLGPAPTPAPTAAASAAPTPIIVLVTPSPAVSPGAASPSQ